MVMRALQNPERWMAALTLDPETGLDPPGVKIRAAQGIDAAQKFIEGYWLWYATPDQSLSLTCFRQGENTTEPRST